MEIDRLEATVDVDSRRAEQQLNRLDRKADEAAEDRHGTITLTVRDTGLNTLGQALTGNRNWMRQGRDSRGRFMPFDNLARSAADAAMPLEDVGRNATRAAGGVSKIWEAMSEAGSSGGGNFLKLASLGNMFGSMGASVAETGVKFAAMGFAIVSLMPLVVALAGYVAGLVAALAPLVGLLFTLPGLFMGLAGVMAVLIMVFKPVIEVIGMLWEAQDNLKENTIALADSQRSLAMAEVQATRAARDYANARRDAAEAIEDAQFAARGAVLAEERAVLNLERAYKRLTDVQAGLAGKTMEIAKVTDDFTGKQFEVARITMDEAAEQEDLKDALLSVKEAELALAQAKDNRQDTEIRLRELESRGIENSDIVIDRTLAKAAAEASLAAAQREVVAAQEALTGQGKEFQQLSPAAQAFAEMVASLKPIFETAQTMLSETIFPLLTQALEDITPLLESVGTLLTPVAEGLGQAAQAFADLMGSESFIDRLNEFFQANGEHIAELGTAFATFTDGLLTLVLEAKPLADALVDIAGIAADMFKDWAEGKSPMGDLTQWFELSADVLRKVFDIIMNLLSGITGFIEAATPFGQWVLDGLLEFSESFNEMTNSAEGQAGIAAFFERIKEPLTAVKDLAMDVVKMFVDIFGSEEAMQFLTDMANMLRTDLLPVIRDLLTQMFDTGFMEKMVDFLGALINLFASSNDFEVLFTSLGVFAEVLTVIADIASVIAQLKQLMNPMEWIQWVLDPGEFEQQLQSFIDSLPDKIVQWVTDADFGSVWDGIAEAFINMINKVIELWNELKIPSFKIGGWDTPFGELPSYHTPEVNFPDITPIGGGGGGGSEGDNGTGTRTAGSGLFSDNALVDAAITQALATHTADIMLAGTGGYDPLTSTVNTSFRAPLPTEANRQGGYDTTTSTAAPVITNNFYEQTDANAVVSEMAWGLQSGRFSSSTSRRPG